MKPSNLYKLQKDCPNEVAVTEAFKALLEGREDIEVFGTKLRREVSASGTEFFRLDTALAATIIVTKPTAGNSYTSLVRMAISEIGVRSSQEKLLQFPSFRGQIKISPKDRRHHLYFFDPFHEEYMRGFLDAALGFQKEHGGNLAELIPDDLKAQMARARIFDVSDPVQSNCIESASSVTQQTDSCIGDNVTQSSVMHDALACL